MNKFRQMLQDDAGLALMRRLREETALSPRIMAYWRDGKRYPGPATRKRLCELMPELTEADMLRENDETGDEPEAPMRNYP